MGYFDRQAAAQADACGFLPRPTMVKKGARAFQSSVGFSLGQRYSAPRRPQFKRPSRRRPYDRRALATSGPPQHAGMIIVIPSIRDHRIDAPGMAGVSEFCEPMRRDPTGECDKSPLYASAKDRFHFAIRQAGSEGERIIAANAFSYEREKRQNLLGFFIANSS